MQAGCLQPFWYCSLSAAEQCGGLAGSNPRAPCTSISRSPFAANDIALSPDGHTLAMVAYWDQTSKYVLWTHPVGGRSAIAVLGTEDASHPFWSPDSRSIAFFSQGKLKKVDLPSGGSAQVLCDAPHGRGGTWNREGTILFSPDFFSGLYRLSLAGGTPVEDDQAGSGSPRNQATAGPFFFPTAGTSFIWQRISRDSFDKNQIFLGSWIRARNGPLSALVRTQLMPIQVICYICGTMPLVAQRFDRSTDMCLAGKPERLATKCSTFPQTDLALFGVAGTAHLVTQTGKGADKSQLTWFNRKGETSGRIGAPGGFANPKHLVGRTALGL